jgi:hypothetical protein
MRRFPTLTLHSPQSLSFSRAKQVQMQQWNEDCTLWMFTMWTKQPRLASAIFTVAIHYMQHIREWDNNHLMSSGSWPPKYYVQWGYLVLLRLRGCGHGDTRQQEWQLARCECLSRWSDDEIASWQSLASPWTFLLKVKGRCEGKSAMPVNLSFSIAHMMSRTRPSQNQS